MNKVKVPKEVAEAFAFYEKQLETMPKKTVHFVLMAVPFSIVHGPAEVLKRFASNDPTQYLQAILQGYEARIDIEDELTAMITEWLNEPYYQDNEREDVKMLVNSIIGHLQKQT
ncbi:hypothetical protein [Gracilibacillus salinarum]|uniref:Uncharacterized protein n=1 Tax=Gracilibacillus salinarum TaxID=2932255 RepID=A0ABY4GMR8_9BACI|nr:hypothetical protein [Gracilibacillus salinarum]UOQ85673.1 hypothetical protein MUN87_01840 [Gracilibacillus salinarum]